MKQAQENPWELFSTTHGKGDKIDVTVKSITDFGLFVGLAGGIDGLIHIADISWDKQSPESLMNKYTKGQELEVIILNIDADKKRISLGIKQLGENNFMTYTALNKKGSIVKGMILEVDPRGAIIGLDDDVTGYLKVGEISQERIEDATTELVKGTEVEVVITNIDGRNRSIEVSIRKKEEADSKIAMDNYNSQYEKGGSLKFGDLLVKK